MTKSFEQRDVVILGGGLVGALLAIALSKKNISCQIIDPQKLEDQFDPAYDGRTTAVNAGCKKIFEALGLWEDLASDATPIHEIRVYEHNSPWSVDYASQNVGGDPLGYILENHLIRKSMHHQIKALDISWHQLKASSSLEFGEFQAYVKADEIIYKCALVVGADGRNSLSRSCTNIRTKRWDYGQKALVCHVVHEKPHSYTAWEIFTKRGPLALLPMANDSITQHYQSGIVWSGPKDSPNLGMDDLHLAKAIEDIFPLYGKIQINSKRWVFPLEGLQVNSCVDRRYALVGDSAHVMHPIAGQGVNLGWRDAFYLSQNLHEAIQSGQDIGSSFVLQNYAKSRQQDHQQLIMATHFIHHLFMHPSKIVKVLRTVGFGVVNHVPPLKYFFMRRAMDI